MRLRFFCSDIEVYAYLNLQSIQILFPGTDFSQIILKI